MHVRGILIRLKGKGMQRVNGHQFYDLAIKVHPLVAIERETTIGVSFFLLWEAREAVIQMLQQIPLRVCVPAAEKVIDGVDSILPREWQEAVAFVTSQESVGYKCYALKEGAKEFETVLAAELQSLDTYLVSQKGTHSTPDLIERAEIMLSGKIRSRIPHRQSRTSGKQAVAWP
jgi:hypothetical protein